MDDQEFDEMDLTPYEEDDDATLHKKLCAAKVARKRAEEDLKLLCNRIGLLKMEEGKVSGQSVTHIAPRICLLCAAGGQEDRRDAQTGDADHLAAPAQPDDSAAEGRAPAQGPDGRGLETPDQQAFEGEHRRDCGREQDAGPASSEAGCAGNQGRKGDGQDAQPRATGAGRNASPQHEAHYLGLKEPSRLVARDEPDRQAEPHPPAARGEVGERSQRAVAVRGGRAADGARRTRADQ